jgi:hypothetical protein
MRAEDSGTELPEAFASAIVCQSVKTARWQKKAALNLI